jgi:hypothetical protein
MKKTLLILALSTIVKFSYAQWTGGSTGPIYYNGGNVGIGTTSPSALLSVNGNSFFTGTITNSGLSGGPAGNFIVNGGSGLFVTRTAAQVLSDIGGVANTGSTNQILYYNRVNKLAGDASFYYEDGSQLLRVTQLWPSALQYNVGNFTSGAISQVLINTNTDNVVKTASSKQLKSWLGYYTSGDSPVFGGLNVTGNVGIGTTDTKGYIFAVNGSAIATSMTVKIYSAWPDYVFEPAYHLPTLASVKDYIDQNQHLPGMPSGQEVNTKGLNLGEIVKIEAQKIEELTLYLIEKDQVQKQQEDKIKQQDARIEALAAALLKLTTGK